MSGAVEGVALLPCPNPWCEGVEGVEASQHIVSGKWHICCDDCMIDGPWADSHGLAIAAWNTRTTPPARSYADEDVARIIDWSAWSWHDRWLVEAETEKMAGRAASLRKDAKMHVAASLAKAASIRLLSQGWKA